jgi:hypothetical protein
LRLASEQRLRVARQTTLGRIEVGHRVRQVAQMVGALSAASGCSTAQHGRQQERNQQADDRNHDQQLDERKTV